ncbi:MAG: triose-phosphate isomerase [Candidatus Nomurabacteria bacterium]|nr:triose-phosphate isomerase [Candidatus Nomurabacteria bacterium]
MSNVWFFWYNFVMNKRTLPILIGNWKSTPDTLQNAIKIVKLLEKKVLSAHPKLPKKPYYLAVPEIFIPHIKEISSGFIGSQNIGGISLGQTTGATIPSQLLTGGADFTLVGHSEVRKRGESEEERMHKVALSLQSKFTTVLCIGESKRDKEGKYLSFLEEDLKESLTLAPKNLFDYLIIAYEPVWAIGQSVPATPQECFEVVISIRRSLVSLVGMDYAKKVNILYGGGVHKDDAKIFLDEGGVDGLLIGQASQDATSFFEVIKNCYSK